MSERFCVLFIPVSGPSGMGEVARCVTIAGELARGRPQVQVHFALSRAAPYLADVPFPMTLFPSSPTFHPRAVATLIEALRPAVVVFDNAGRTAQLAAARRLGARVVYVSSRRRQRGKAFRLRWMHLLDDHWIAYPAFIAGELAWHERLKLRCLRRPAVRFLDAVLPLADDLLAAKVMSRLEVRPREYLLVVPGGGTTHRGARHTPASVAEVARRVAARGQATVLVGAGDASHTPALPALRVSARLPVAEVCELIRGARLVLCNGGDTLLQAIALQRPCIAVSMAKDQAHRIDRCARAGVALEGRADSEALVAQVLALLDAPTALLALQARLAEAPLSNALESVVESLAPWATEGAR